MLESIVELVLDVFLVFGDVIVGGDVAEAGSDRLVYEHHVVVGDPSVVVLVSLAIFVGVGEWPEFEEVAELAG